jgi:hypothetical protein
MELLELFIISCIIVISFGLLTLSLLVYRKTRNNKMLVISMVFLIFFIKVLLYNISLYFSDIDFYESMTVVWIFDLIVLLLLYIASIKR